MTTFQKRMLWLTLGMALIAFVIFAIPNAAASKDLSMVQVFEPDEAAVLPYVFNMIAPAPTLNLALRHFIFYDYYFYGFPYFAISAIVLLPLQILGQINNIPLVMLILRQFVSVLPFLIGLLLLVYLQDGFRSYRSPVLFGFLLVVPAVMANNSWYHPDGIVFLLVVLTIFFLFKDNLRFGKNFLLAAVMCGIATATKLVGVYFFLAIALTLFLGIILRKASWKKLAVMALAFLLTMGAAYVVSNPFLLSHWARTAYSYIFQKQQGLLASGYGVIYPKGLTASWPDISKLYGGAIFLLIALGSAVWASVKGPQRLLHGLILAWLIPLTFTSFFLVSFKFQYWLPAALPLLSSLVILLPERWTWNKPAQISWFARMALILAVAVQGIAFINADVQKFEVGIHREENSKSIKFYNNILNTLKPLPDADLSIYYDNRMYMPAKPGWITKTTFDLLDYGYIQENNFDVLALQEQRILDYLNPNVTGINPSEFKLNQQFYRDAQAGNIQGYQLVFRDSFGLIYIRDDLFQKYFPK